MNVAITGTSTGMGRAFALKFLNEGHTVVGFDVKESSIDHPNYTHMHKDVRDKDWTFGKKLPKFDILISNAGIQTPEFRVGTNDIDVNLKGAINFMEWFLKDKPKAALFIGSVSAHSGFEFPEYVASKGGVVTYMKSVALRMSKWGGVCNSLDPGGVLTELNRPVMDDPEIWKEIMDVTPLKRWMEPEEVAEWAYFLTVTQSFCTGQSIVVDGGEKDLQGTFKWPGWE